MKGISCRGDGNGTGDQRHLGAHPGQGCYAAALTAKGKIVADVRVFVEEDAHPRRCAAARGRGVGGYGEEVRESAHRAAQTTRAPRCATSASSVSNARHVVSELTGIQAPALTALAPYAHVSVQVDGATLLVAKVPELEVEGFELIVPADSFTRCGRAR